MNCAECNHSAVTHQDLGAVVASADDTPKSQNEEQQPSNSLFWRSIPTLCTAECTNAQSNYLTLIGLFSLRIFTCTSSCHYCTKLGF